MWSAENAASEPELKMHKSPDWEAVRNIRGGGTMPADEGGGDCGSLTAEEDGGCPRLDDVRDGINRPLPDWSPCQ